MGEFKERDIVSVRDFNREEIEAVLERAMHQKKRAREGKLERLLAGKIMASCFFEPSTRTRLSFEAAMKRMGGEVIGFAESQSTSAKKGESLGDCVQVIASYADVIVLRHPLEGASRLAASLVDVPIINAGDGANEHPSQTLLDLFTIQECFGKIDELQIAFVGDLKHGRTVHSLALALKQFNVRLFFVSPEALAMPEKITAELKEAAIPFSFHREIEEVTGRADLLYMTRIQEERFFDRMEYEEMKGCFALKESHLKSAKPSLKIFHPLPRLKEIEVAIDSLPQAAYFLQAKNGLYVREALLSMIL